MVKDTSDNTAKIISESYDLSGGEIENIERKQTVDKIIYGQEEMLDDFHRYCRGEKLSKNTRKRLGFRMNNN